ncbi:MAG: PQQ-binding-like beta-propeller repeat protein [Pirellulales bacterium]
MTSKLLTACLVAALFAGICRADELAWPQFRGPNATGRAADKNSLPAEIGPDQHVAWKIELPPGHSSPVVAGNRVFVTAVRGEQLLTMALDRQTGNTLWEAEAPHESLEKIHGIGSYAQPTPATDGERVVSMFGSSGLYCHDVEGRLLWSHSMGPFVNDFGAGSSPIIVDDRVILCQDHDLDSFLAAYDKQTGKLLWKADRSEFPRNYCTPVVWQSGGKKQIVVAATLRVVGYDWETGEELWTVRGLSRAVCVTPAVGDDGVLYVAGWSAGADAEQKITIEPFDTVIRRYDENKNELLDESEVPDDSPVHPRFSQFDRDKSGGITRDEFEYYRGLFDKSHNVVMAIQPGPVGEATDSHVLWQYNRNVPFCSSPLYLPGLVFTVKDGGIVTSLDAKTGKALKTARLDATDDYYASPVSGDGKVYLTNQEGQLTVLSAEGKWEVLATADFAEQVYATPAIVDGKIYYRTVRHLYCFE